MSLELKDLSSVVIGAAIEVHRQLGPGFLESIYENSPRIELRKRGVVAEFQKEVRVFYDGEMVGLHRVDLLVADQLVVELKAIKAHDDVHFAQVRSYLKALNLKHGLLINFATHPLTVKRVIAPTE
ncbi:MAG: GxxExxY protein [Verrucomicrobiae bacterium]|nr:GxxExxY protein [Verrucomicrobiae bacterium]